MRAGWQKKLQGIGKPEEGMTGSSEYVGGQEKIRLEKMSQKTTGQESIQLIGRNFCKVALFAIENSLPHGMQLY